jgi:hypothetical protein
MTQQTAQTIEVVPWWEEKSCPSWCEGHGANEVHARPGDQNHFSGVLTVVGRRSATGRPEVVSSYLRQATDEPRPQVSICLGSEGPEIFTLGLPEFTVWMNEMSDLIAGQVTSGPEGREALEVTA